MLGGRAMLGLLAAAGCAAHAPAAAIEGVLGWVVARGGRSGVRVATDANGVRGLAASSDAEVGDVLLEVPLSLALADSCPQGCVNLDGEPPAWSAPLAWNAQLALAVLAHRADADSPWRELVASWPDSPPPLPKDLEADELAEAQDVSVETEADTAYFWLEDQYILAREAAEAEAPSALSSFPPPTDFRWAMQMVWSRCLRVTAGRHGTRRLLLPALDLANHDPTPSALYAHTDAAACGDAVRLYAARPLCAGDAVTITYGDHGAAHFAQYYGFVPRFVPHESWPVRPALLDAAVRQILGPKVAESRRASEVDECCLLAAAPSCGFLDAVRRHVGIEGAEVEAPLDARVFAVAAEVCNAIESSMPTTAEADVAALSANLAPSSDAVRVLIELRLARKRQLRRIGANMRRLGVTAARRPEIAARRLARLQLAPSTYPALDALTVEELERWAQRRE